jgi:hypothetical protein
VNVIAIDKYIGWLSQLPSSQLINHITVWYEQLESFVEIPVELIERQQKKHNLLKNQQTNGAANQWLYQNGGSTCLDLI